MDNLTKEQRHKNMKNIKSKDTKIEVILRKALWKKGIRYRKNYDSLPGKPDIVITKYRIAIFCDGEFFHGYDWENQKSRLEKNYREEQISPPSCPLRFSTFSVYLNKKALHNQPPSVVQGFPQLQISC